MQPRTKKVLVSGTILGAVLLAAIIFLKPAWRDLAISQIAAGVIGGVLITLGVGTIRRRLRFRFSAHTQTHRIDTLPEPLTVHECLYRTNPANPMEGWIPHDQYQVASELSFVKGAFRFVTPANTADEWDYIYLDEGKFPWRDYSWRLKIKRDTAFREFAFNFRYQDFDNRYRYRFEDDKIFFDKKVRGEWTNNIASSPFTMKLGQWYDLRIDVCATLCRCYVDEHLWLENTDTDLSWGSICIILWEDDGRTDMHAEVGPIVVHEIRHEVLATG